MALAHSPRIVSDGLILNIDPINLEKNLTTNTSTNFLQNGSFSGGTGVTYESGSVPTNTIIELKNPGDSQYVLRQNGNFAEYQMNIDGGAQGTLSASTQYVMSGWYAKSSDYNGGDTMFHARAHSSGGSHNSTGTGIGTLLHSKVVGGLTWEFRYETITTPSDYDGNFDWYMGYGTNNTAGYRYYTGLKVEEGSFPSTLDLSRNGIDAKVKGATFNSDGYFTFDGTDDYISFSSQVSADLTTGFTFGFLIKVPSAQNNTGWNYILSDRDTSPNGDYEIGIYSNNNTNFLFKDNDIVPASISTTLGTGWNYLVFGQNSSFGRFIYLNGVLKASSSVVSGNSTIEFDKLFIRENTINPFKCDSSVIHLYDRELTASEIQQNFNALRGRFGI